MRRIRIVLVLIVFAMIINASIASAETPYQSYNYDYWNNIVPSPVSYVPERTISGQDLGIGSFKSPSDMFITPEGEFYLLDSSNARIVVFNEDLQVIRTITGFQKDGKEETFSEPNGICVQDNKIYVADTDNNRIVILSKTGELINIISSPKSEMIADDFLFFPMKISLDRAGRMYIVAKNVYEGMMSFDKKGKFIGYYGTIKVQYNIADLIWRELATKKQKEKMLLFIPTEYTNLDIDDEGFVYATNIDFNSSQTINRLNPSGADVIKKYSDNIDGNLRPIIGDLEYTHGGMYSGPTKFIDIKGREKGLYSALDATRGRIFTYDSEGNLLYIFGGLGNQSGMFKIPNAIEFYNNKFYIVDKGRSEITIFKPTRYGELINTAVGLRYDGNEAGAVKIWEEVLKLDANYQLAYSGIGKSLLAANENKEALKFLKLGMNKRYYSIAFKRYRNDFLKANADGFIIGVIALSLLYYGYRMFFKKKNKPGNQLKIRKYFKLPLYTMSHPADGFYQMKYEKKGIPSIITVNLLLFWISYSFRKQYTGFLLNETNPINFNAFKDLISIVAIFTIWCIANWSITTLMNGEGKMKDIAMATSYSFMPMIMSWIPITIISNFLVESEKDFYNIIINASIVWFLVLLFMGILSVHDYTVGKTIKTIVLTFASIFVILFLLLLVFSLGQQVWIFIRSLFIEILYRS